MKTNYMGNTVGDAVLNQKGMIRKSNARLPLRKVNTPGSDSVTFTLAKRLCEHIEVPLTSHPHFAMNGFFAQLYKNPGHIRDITWKLTNQIRPGKKNGD